MMPRVTWCTLLIVAATAAPAIAAQEAADSTLVRTLLVGSSETATLELTRIPRPGDPALPWRLREPPLTAGTGTAALLRTDLPIRFAGHEIAPGRYRLWIEDGNRLVITRELPVEVEQFTAEDVIARIEMADSVADAAVPDWSLGVVTTRHGADTLSSNEDRSRRIIVVSVKFHPATSSVLQLRYAGKVLSVPVSAR